jgi:hypothetical protein
MKCPICEKDAKAICSCGFCLDCIKEYGHPYCTRKLEEIALKKDEKQ